MPGWVVIVALAAAVAVLILVLGSVEALTIFALMGVWFLAVGGFALLVEIVIQATGRRVRRTR